MGVSGLIRLGLMPRKPSYCGRRSRLSLFSKILSHLELPSLNQKMFRRKKEEEEEKEEESRGISKAFSFVKVGRHTYLGNVGMSRLGWRHGLMEEVK
ncbi:hypothetical protein ACFX2C_028152 [Malus domestica]